MVEYILVVAISAFAAAILLGISAYIAVKYFGIFDYDKQDHENT